MIVISVAKLNLFLPESEISLRIKPKRNVFVESLDQFRRLEVREKVRNVFVMCLRLYRYYTTSHLHQVFSISPGFSLVSLVFRTSKLLESKEFNKNNYSIRACWI